MAEKEAFIFVPADDKEYAIKGIGVRHTPIPYIVPHKTSSEAYWSTQRCVQHFSSEDYRPSYKTVYSLLIRHGIDRVVGSRGMSMWVAEQVKGIEFVARPKGELHQSLDRIPDGYMSLSDMQKRYNLKQHWICNEIRVFNIKAVKVGNLLFVHPKDVLELANWVDPRTLRHKCSKEEYERLRNAPPQRPYPPLLSRANHLKRIYAPQYSNAFFSKS